MSGGYFSHAQFSILNIAENLESAIMFAKGAWAFSPETVAEMEQTLRLLKHTYIRVHRIDYLLSGDDGEDTFHERLKQELEELQQELLQQGGTDYPLAEMRPATQVEIERWKDAVEDTLADREWRQP